MENSDKNYDKWNNYVIGDIHFSKNNHPHRKIFTDYVVNSCESVIEIGPGEMIEYQTIRSSKNIDYTIVDVSDLFINNCKKQYPEVRTIHCPMEQMSLKKMGNKKKVRTKKDVVYGASVIEHSKDPVKSLKNMMSLAYNFHIVFFKWSYNDNLSPRYHSGRRYWSSKFGVYALLKTIEKFGEIEYCDLVTQENKRIPFDGYTPENKVDLHRNGDYLVVHGKCTI